MLTAPDFFFFFGAKSLMRNHLNKESIRTFKSVNQLINISGFVFPFIAHTSAYFFIRSKWRNMI